MTFFLPAGIINETVSDINQKAGELKNFLSENNRERLEETVNELEEMSLNLWVFIEQFNCQPLIYTGPGSTEEIIRRLEWALAFSEEADEGKLMEINEQKQSKKKA